MRFIIFAFLLHVAWTLLWPIEAELWSKPFWVAFIPQAIIVAIAASMIDQIFRIAEDRDR